MHSTGEPVTDGSVEPSFIRSATVYDAIYAAKGKDYAGEARRLWRFIGLADAGATLLDVGCGTAEHLRHLAESFDVTGVDRATAMLEVARRKLPHATFVEGDMRTFALDRRFDVVTSLFSSVGYLPDRQALDEAMSNMAAHLRPGGVLLVEPALRPDGVAAAREIVTSARVGDLEVVRRASADRDGNRLEIEFVYDIAGGERREQFRERHSISLFSHGDYVAAMEAAGLRSSFDADGCSGIGLFIGRSS